MKNRTLLVITSFTSVVLFILHVTGDIALGYEKGSVYPVIPIALVFLYGTLVLRARLAGVIIMLLGGLASAGMPLLHWKLYAVAGNGAVGFFFVAIVLAMGVTGLFGFILSLHVLWDMWRSRAHKDRSESMSGNT